MRTPLKGGAVAEMATGGEEEGKRQKHAAVDKRRGSHSGKHTAHSFFSQLMLSCSPISNSINKKQKEQRIGIFVKKKKKKNSQFNATKHR